MGINEKLRQLRLKLRRAWHSFQGTPDPAATAGPGVPKPKRNPAIILRSETIEQEIVQDVIQDTQEQCAELDEAMRGGNGHGQAEGEHDYDETTQL